MAKNSKNRRWIFPIVLLAYALVFLVGTAIGLDYLWDYMDAYERTRPHTALNAYMEKLTPEYIADGCDELIAKIDRGVQSEDACRKMIVNSLSEKITCAKKTTESTENHHVYVVRCGAKIIGTMEMDRNGEEVQGLTTWQVTKDSFDLSYLVTNPKTITVPENFSVYAGDTLLSKDYITKDKLQYSLLKEFYSSFTLPSMVTYTAGPFLGEVELTAKDAEGNAVVFDENTDMNAFLTRATDAEKKDLDKIIEDFLTYHMKMSANAGNSPTANYNALKKYMVPNGDLSKRMKEAIGGLKWITDRGAKMKSINTAEYISLGDGRYMCDVTYVVNVYGLGGRIDTTTRVKLILLETDNGLKAEAMITM